MRGLAILLAAVASFLTAAPAMAKERKLSPADRAAINATLDVFVNHGVKRQGVGAAYDVVTPTMRDGMTRKEWAKGDIPIYPYPAAGRQFHKWTIFERTSQEVGIELILAPPASQERKIGQISFTVYLKPGHGRWLVDSFIPAATFAPVGKAPVVGGPGDFSGSAGGLTYNRPSIERDTKPSRVSGAFIFVPFAAIGLLLAGLAGWGLVHGIRQRRLNRLYAPSPLSIPADGTRARPRQQP
jgi:hypothetical protein